MLSSEEDQRVRRETLRNDQRVREQQRSSTFFHQTHIDDAGGRFAAVNAATVVGSNPEVASAYPAASAAHQTELPPEMPLGYRIDELEPSSSAVAQALGDAVAPSAPLDVEPASPLSLAGDPTSEVLTHRISQPQGRVGPPVPYRRI
jgi:hypothetical protein